MIFGRHQNAQNVKTFNQNETVISQDLGTFVLNDCIPGNFMSREDLHSWLYCILLKLICPLTLPLQPQLFSILSASRPAVKLWPGRTKDSNIALVLINISVHTSRCI